MRGKLLDAFRSIVTISAMRNDIFTATVQRQIPALLLRQQQRPVLVGPTAKRAALWCFREIATLRRPLIQRARRYSSCWQVDPIHE